MTTYVRRFYTKARQDGLHSAFYRLYKWLSYQPKRFSRTLQMQFLYKPIGRKIVRRRVNGSEMILDATDPGISYDLASKGIREKASTQRFENVLNRLKNRFDAPIHVFDVGANIGYYVLLEALILGDQGNIYAVEAEPRNVDALRQNVRLNGYSQVQVLQVAAGAEHSALQLELSSKSNTHRMVGVSSKKSGRETIEVDVVPLDHLIEERNIPGDELLVVRMDIEGYEGYAFKGMKNLLVSDRPCYVFVEIHSSEPLGNVIDALAENGFELNYASLNKGDTLSSDSQTWDDLREIDQDIHVMASKL